MAVDYNILIDNGTFAPSLVRTPAVAKYLSFKTIWLNHFSINTYYGHWYTQRNLNPPAASFFNPININCEAWAIAAKARGVDCIGVTVINEYGFCIYPSEVNYNMPQINLSNGRKSPFFQNRYCVQPEYDVLLLDKFVAACVKHGIEPMFYVGMGADSNLAGISMWDPAIPTDRRQAFIDYRCKILQELARKFPRVKYYWIDMADGYMVQNNPEAVQRFYNALKSINPDLTFIGNVAGEHLFERFPYDIQSTEEYAIFDGNDVYKRKISYHDGVGYPIGQEIVATPYDFSFWYYIDDLCPVQPGIDYDGQTQIVKMRAQAPSLFQSIIDKARDEKIPFTHCMMTNRNGVLVQELLDYVGARDLSFPHNILPNQQNLKIARTTKDFFKAGINESNMIRVTKVGNPKISFDPSKKINRLQGLERNSAYYFRAKKKVDLINDTSPSIEL